MNKKQKDELFIETFSLLQDNRVDRTKKYPLIYIILIVLFGIAAGAVSWRGLVLVAQLNKKWISNFIKIDCVPSKDTIARVMRSIDPVKLNECFVNWVTASLPSLDGMTVPIDGKTVRSAFTTGMEKSPLHMVSAWCTELGVCLGQVKTDEKSNEITAIPILLEMLNAKGAVVTMDAMGCQTDIARLIRKKRAHYILAVKRNQTDTLNAIKAVLDKHYDDKNYPLDDCYFEAEPEAGHGRIDTRKILQLPVKLVPFDLSRWHGIQSVIMVEAERHSKKTATYSTERRYFISSCPVNAKQALKHVRAHWGIEAMHWQLDVTYHEDGTLKSAGYAVQNFNILNKIMLVALRKLGKSLNLSGPLMKLMFAHPTRPDIRELALFGRTITSDGPIPYEEAAKE